MTLACVLEAPLVTTRVRLSCADVLLHDVLGTLRFELAGKGGSVSKIPLGRFVSSEPVSKHRLPTDADAVTPLADAFPKGK